jgi:cyclophilin family peptidyl-prolyl cis-trans isomerase/HEAT repeat protein
VRTFTAVLAASLVLAACGAQAPPFVLGPERDRVVLSDPEIEAMATILRLEDHRRFEPETFQRLSALPHSEVRRRAATAAGRIGDPAAAIFLTQVLARDPSPAVRADAAFAIGLLGDTSTSVLGALRQAAPRDWTPVRPEEATVVVEIVGALGRIGTDAARAEVVDVLRRVQRADDPISRQIAAEALLAVWKFPTGAGRAVSALRFVGHPDPELRWRATLALVRLGATEGTSRLLPLLDDTDPRVRALAARGLAAPAVDSAGIADAAAAALVAALADPHPHVRINAVRALGTFGDRAPEHAIVDRTTDEDPNVSVAAAAALGNLGARVAPTLVAIAAGDALPIAARATALAALARLDPDAALPVFDAWARARDDRRYAAAHTLASLGWPRARHWLEALAADSDARVAVAATEAAATLAAAPDLDPTVAAELRGLLLRLIAADDPRQRTVALRGAVPLLRSTELDAVLDAFERASRDPAARATAIAAIHAVGTLEVATPGPAAVFFDRFRPADDRWIRRAVADTLGDRWGVPPAAAVADDEGFYREIVQRFIAPVLAGGRRPEAAVRTPHGDIRIELLSEEAPLTVHNFATLAASGYYDEGVWHRVVPNFVLQDGAPAGDPTGGPGWTIRDELNRVRYDRGVVGMALAGPDTGGSQWFITHSPQPHLDAGYTAFGRVVAGESVMDRVVQGDAVSAVRIRF